MKVHTDTEVAVLSTRTDLDLAISTWLPGYAAQHTEDLDTAMDVARRGGIVLIDLGAARHEEWVTALRERGFEGPAVFLDPKGEVTIDLTDRVVVPSPPSLSGLLAGFEEAQVTGRGPRRRSVADADPRIPARRRQRRSAAPEITSRSDRREAAAEGGGTGRGGRLDRPQAVEDQAVARVEQSAGRSRRSGRRDASQEPAVPRARRGDLRKASEEPAVPRRSDRLDASQQRAVARARRSDRRQGSWTLFGSPRRRSASAAGEGPVAEGVAPRGAGPPPRIDAEAERAFQEVFRDAERQPSAQRRIATPEGRVRVQTDEELFAEHSAAAPTEAVPGTVLTPAPPRGH